MEPKNGELITWASAIHLVIIIQYIAQLNYLLAMIAMVYPWSACDSQGYTVQRVQFEHRFVTPPLAPVAWDIPPSLASSLSYRTWR